MDMFKKTVNGVRRVHNLNGRLLSLAQKRLDKGSASLAELDAKLDERAIAKAEAAHEDRMQHCCEGKCSYVGRFNRWCNETRERDSIMCHKHQELDIVICVTTDCGRTVDGDSDICWVCEAVIAAALTKKLQTEAEELIAASRTTADAIMALEQRTCELAAEDKCYGIAVDGEPFCAPHLEVMENQLHEYHQRMEETGK